MPGLGKPSSKARLMPANGRTPAQPSSKAGFGMLSMSGIICDPRVLGSQKLAGHRNARPIYFDTAVFYDFGKITASITWITPFEVAMSALTTFAPSTFTPFVASIEIF